MSALTCIGEPVSWLRLERHALEPDARVTEHVAACAACRACLGEIERDVVALPPLPAVPARRRPWWHLALPIGGALVAAAVLLLVIRPREVDPVSDTTRIKGLGTVVVDVVRERAGTVTGGVRTYAAGDRWKVLVTCAEPGTARMTVDVDGDRPLPAADVVCGNRIVLPGAFSLTGAGDQRVCVTIDSDGERGAACVTLRPE